jgi:hypothetical protein
VANTGGGKRSACRKAVGKRRLEMGRSAGLAKQGVSIWWSNSAPRSMAFMPIHAECHSDDYVVEVNFDAEPWFAQASDEELCALARCGWGGDYPADEIARFASEMNEDVQRMFAYLELVRQKRDAPGFECHVEERAAIEWISVHRPQFLER